MCCAHCLCAQCSCTHKHALLRRACCPRTRRGRLLYRPARSKRAAELNEQGREERERALTAELDKSKVAHMRMSVCVATGK